MTPSCKRSVGTLYSQRGTEKPSAFNSLQLNKANLATDEVCVEKKQISEFLVQTDTFRRKIGETVYSL